MVCRGFEKNERLVINEESSGTEIVSHLTLSHNASFMLLSWWLAIYNYNYHYLLTTISQANIIGCAWFLWAVLWNVNRPMPILCPVLGKWTFTCKILHLYWTICILWIISRNIYYDGDFLYYWKTIVVWMHSTMT